MTNKEIRHNDPANQLAAADYPADENPALVYIASLSSKHSQRVMRHALRVLVALVNRQPLADIGNGDALAFPWHKLRYQHTQAIRTGLQDRYSYSSVNRILSALRGVLKECWRLGHMDNEDMARACDIENVKGSTLPSGRRLEHSEIRALLETCWTDANEALGIRDAALISILYSTGIRRAEIVGLNLDHYSSTEQGFQFMGKRNKERTVYIDNGALDAWGDWLAIRGDESGAAFLPVRRGGNITRRTDENEHLIGITAQSIYVMLQRRVATAGLADLSPHDLRRTFITEQIEKGTDLITVASIAGHSSVDTTRRYDMRGEQAKKRAAGVINVPYKKRRKLIKD